MNLVFLTVFAYALTFTTGITLLLCAFFGSIEGHHAYLGAIMAAYGLYGLIKIDVGG